jgi:hypothetical protein
LGAVKYIQDFSGKTRSKEPTRKIQKYMEVKTETDERNGMVVWIGLIWLIIKTCGGLLFTW